jgi:hypothetical protein
LLTADETVKALPPSEMIKQGADPLIAQFENWFSQPQVGNSSLTRMEREMLRSFIFYVSKVRDDSVAISG